MTYQIADAKTRYFNDKQHYLNFLDAWKRATKSVNCKATKNKYYGNKEPGWLTGAHMLLYAILRGKDARTAFTPITRQSKLEGGAYINHGMYSAYQELCFVTKFAYVPILGEDDQVKEFLAPFNGTLDKEILDKVVEDMPKITALYSNYGSGVSIAKAFSELDVEYHPKILWQLIEEME